MKTKRLAASISAAVALCAVMASRAAWSSGPPGGVVGGEGLKDEGGEGKRSDARAPKLLTAEQINRIRYMELVAIRDPDAKYPDPVTVKISDDTIKEFLVSMEGDSVFEGKRKFMRLTPPQKLHQIAYYKGAAYADKVEILSDPVVFKDFKRKVMPKVLRSCAKAGCHTTTSDADVGLRLYTDPKRSATTTYTNFITLNDYKLGEDAGVQYVIDRELPDESLLLLYMLPKEDVKAGSRHPGDVKYRPPFQSRGVIGYKHILRWIRSLKHPAEDYGLHPPENDKSKDKEPGKNVGDADKREGSGKKPDARG